jgi:hypothetical protein
VHQDNLIINIQLTNYFQEVDELGWGCLMDILTSIIYKLIKIQACLLERQELLDYWVSG